MNLQKRPSFLSSKRREHRSLRKLRFAAFAVIGLLVLACCLVVTLSGLQLD